MLSKFQLRCPLDEFWVIRSSEMDGNGRHPCSTTKVVMCVKGRAAASSRSQKSSIDHNQHEHYLYVEILE